MKYKLKEHVTDEMLIGVGFEVEVMQTLMIEFPEKTAWRDMEDIGEDDDNKLFIVLDEISDMPKGTVDTLYTVDITPYIQDLINLGYVEVVE
jgi:hypothetical protein